MTPIRQIRHNNFNLGATEVKLPRKAEMKISMNKFEMLMAALLLAFGISACGGGGGGGNSGAPSTPIAVKVITLKGTAATGAPITSATVTLIDSAGQSKTVATDSNGNYSLDVTSLKPPLLLKLTGQNADGTPVLLYSAIDAFDDLLSPTANITPLTNAALVLATGQNATEFYGSPDPTKLTAENLKAANTKLKDELGGVLANSGTDSTVDFTKSSFVANKSGVDLLMESFDIKTNPPTKANGASSVALIGKLYMGGKIITPPSGGLSNGSAAVTGNLSIPSAYQGVNFRAIDGLIESANQIIKSGIGSATQVTQLNDLTDPGFLNYGQNSQTFWNNVVSNGSNAKIFNVSILGCNFTAPLICELIGSVGTDGNRNSFSTSVIFNVNKNLWEFFGNRKITDFSVTTTLFRETYFTKSTLTRNAYSGYEVVVNTDGSGASIDSAKLYVFIDNAWQLIDTVQRRYDSAAPTFLYKEVTLADSLINRLNASALVNGVSVRLDLLDAGGNQLSSNFLYSVCLPLLSTDVANFKFPEITDSGIQQLRQYNGEKTLTLNISPGNGVFSVNEFNWNQYFTPGQAISSTDLTLRSTVVNITFANTLTMLDHTHRAFDFYGFTADGMKIHTRNAGCNVEMCY